MEYPDISQELWQDSACVGRTAMKKNILALIFVYLIQCVPSHSSAQGVSPVLPLEIMASILGSGGEMQSTPISATLEQATHQLNIKWPTDSISYSQLQNVIRQVPGAANLNVQFPNQTGWVLNPAELLALHNKYLQQAGGLGFGVGGGNIPEMVFSSLVNQAGGPKALAMIPITQLKNGMAETLEPMLREMRYQQLALSEWMPGWMKDTLLYLYNLVMPYYYSLVNWISSFF